jgi:hypothetical protein
MYIDYPTLVAMGHEFESKGIKIPRSFFIGDLGLSTIDEVVDWVCETSENEEEMGILAEGFVVYYQSAPIAKVKSRKYLEYIGFSGGNIRAARNSIIRAVLNKQLDDVEYFLTDEMRRFADQVVAVLANVLAATERVWEEARSAKDRKEYAAIVNAADIPPFMRSVVFAGYGQDTFDTGYYFNDRLGDQKFRNSVHRWLKKILVSDAQEGR